jgi:hypothetical protein
MLMKKSALVLALLLSTSVFAAGKAKVLMVRGKATKLLPGAKKATPVKRGEMLPEDTSIVTKDKSIVRLKFADKSSVNIGPKSMLVVSKMPKKKANMLNLLTGAIKSEVDKRNQKTGSKNKMIIKTRSAVMGVRGTKFQTIYNPANKSTSLVTIEGKVAMVKRKQTPPKVIKKVVEKPVESAAEQGASEAVKEKVVEQVAVVQSPEDELAELDNVLETSEEVVEVPEGRYSGVVEKAETATEPVKIAPKQYDALAKSMNSKKKAKDVMKTTKEEAAKAAKTAGKTAPRAGGYIDFQTGIYVAPPEDAKLDKTTGTFKAKEDIGTIDAETGDYVPPKGVELDAKKGFVIKEEKGEKVAMADKKRLQRTLAKLNNEVKKQVVVNKVENKKNLERKWYQPEKHILSAEFIPYSEAMTVKNKNSGSESNFYSSQASKLLVTWGQRWSDKITSRLILGNNDLEWDDSNFDTAYYENSNGGDYVALGADYKYNFNWTFGVDYVSESLFYIYPGGDNNGTALYSNSSNFDYLQLSTRYFIYDWKMFEVYANGGIKLYGEDTVSTNNGDRDADSFGFYAGLTGMYAWKENMGINITAYFESTSIDVEDLEYSRTNLGTGANFVWEL